MNIPDKRCPEEQNDVCYLAMRRKMPGIRVVRRYQAEFGLSYRKMTLYLLFFSVLAVSHWLACTLGIIHKFQIESFGRDGWDWFVGQDLPMCIDCILSIVYTPSQEVHHELKPSRFQLVQEIAPGV